MSSRHRISFAQPPSCFRHAARVIVNAPANWRTLQREAQTAFERGRESGQAEVAERLSSVHSALGAAVVEAQQVLERRFAELEPQVVDLVVEVARNVIGGEIEAGNYDVAGIVHETLRGLRGLERELEVRLHPQDFASLRGSGIDDGEGLHYVTDPEVPLAGCRVLTSYGTIVRESGELLDQIRQVFHDLAGGATHEPPTGPRGDGP